MKMNYGDLWVETLPEGTINVGFTQPCIEEKLQECFHVLPADVVRTKREQPLLVLETNDGLVSIKSPVNGHITFFSDKARNFPDRLSEEDVIVTLITEEQRKKSIEKAKKNLEELRVERGQAQVQPFNFGAGGLVVDDFVLDDFVQNGRAPF